MVTSLYLTDGAGARAANMVINRFFRGWVGTFPKGPNSRFTHWLRPHPDRDQNSPPSF